jgi:hypothetical protein
MFRKAIYFLLNPFFQALLVAGAFIFFVPLGLKKYVAEQVDIVTSFEHTKYYFDDLDLDGNSERIQTFLNLSGNAGISLVKGMETVGQWNFKGIFQAGSPRIMIGDFNQNHAKEIYIFTVFKDTILLHALEYGREPRLFLQDRFIARLGKTLQNPDFVFYPGKVTEMNGDSLKDLVFAISAGHSRQPRNVFLYDIQKDSLKVSPRSGAFIGYMAMDDLDKDGFDEILAGTFASSNYNDESVEYTDTSSWAMVYDHNLQFLFPPVEYPSPTGGVQLLPFNMPDGTKRIIGNALYGTLENKEKKTFISDLNGKILAEKDFDINDPLFNLGLNPSPRGRNPHKILGSLEKVGFYEIDHNLDIRKISDAKFAARNPEVLDIDQDGEEEIIYINIDHKSHVILRSDMSGPVEIDFPIQSVMPLFSVKLSGSLPPQISVSGDQVWKLFSYGINPLYRFRILVYIGIYLSILGFILLIRKLYSIQLKRRYETEKKITALQLSSIKAQMEPHFIFNVINSIGSSIYREKKDEAYQMVVRFSNMVRTLLSTSDQLYRTLHEELEFVTNFLELEKQRFPELFDFRIDIEPQTNRELLVPKMILQLHSENALKHGIRPKGMGGLLEISVGVENGYLVLIIQDNGIGRQAAEKLISHSTGKGMKMLSQFFETYNKHNAKPILQEITDLADESGQPAGTRVTVRVPVEFNAEIF